MSKLYNINTHALVQVTLLGGQFLLPVFIPMPPEKQAAVSGFISAVQAYLGYQAFKVNPDGTPASQPFEEKK